MSRVGDIMKRELVTVGPDDSVEACQALFGVHCFHHLLVVDKGRLIGVISDRDLLRNLSPFIGHLGERRQDAALLQRRVHQIMRRTPVTVSADAPACDAAHRMISEKVSCLPIVDDRGRPVGIITWRDLLGAMCPLDPPAPAPA